MRAYYYILIISLLTSFSCNYSEKKTDNNFTYLIDTFKIGELKNVKYIDDGYYEPIYIGKFQDTISTEREKYEFERFLMEHENESKKYFNDYFLDSNTIFILVDTNQIIANFSFRWLDNFNGHGISRYKGHPILIRNNSNKRIKIGTENRITLRLEAIDSTGSWSPIESFFTPFCGTNSIPLLLDNNEIAITTFPIYTGNYSTKIRIRFNNLISESFSGKINYTQFHIRPK